MTGSDFLLLSKELLKTDTEAARRTSVSRAYYALYHYVRAYLNSSGISVSTGPEEHQRMTRYLKNTGMDDIKYIGKKMDDIRALRNNADYKLGHKGFDKKSCTFNCALTEALISTLDGADKPTLQAGLVQYARSINEL